MWDKEYNNLYKTSMCKRASLKKVPSKTAGVIQRVSMGKYDQGLYLDEKR